MQATSRRRPHWEGGPLTSFHFIRGLLLQRGQSLKEVSSTLKFSEISIQSPVHLFIWSIF